MWRTFNLLPFSSRGRFFFHAEDGIRDPLVTGVQTCALPICAAGQRLPEGLCTTDNLGRRVCSQIDSAVNPAGRLNPNVGTLRVWQNVVNSNYNAFQFSLKKQASHGITLNLN